MASGNEGREHFNRGEQDRVAHENKGTVEKTIDSIGIGGTSSYQPPSGAAEKAEYDKGWDNNH